MDHAYAELAAQETELLPSRLALSGLDINVVVQVPVNLAIAVLGSTAVAAQKTVGAVV